MHGLLCLEWLYMVISDFNNSWNLYLQSRLASELKKMKASKNAFLIINKYEKCNKQAISEVHETARQLNQILDAIEVHLNQNEFDSLVSLCFSLSTKEFLKTHLFDLLEANADRKEIAKEFKHLNEVRIGGTIQNGRSSKSLVERRKAEKDLFLTPLYICDV